jgi:hypothetical protein
MSTQTIELEGFEIELASSSIVSAAEIIVNWWIVRVCQFRHGPGKLEIVQELITQSGWTES